MKLRHFYFPLLAKMRVYDKRRGRARGRSVNCVMAGAGQPFRVDRVRPADDFRAKNTRRRTQYVDVDSCSLQLPI